MQNTVTGFARSILSGSRPKRNKWGQPVGGTVYAGFGLELEDAERSGAWARLGLDWSR